LVVGDSVRELRTCKDCTALLTRQTDLLARGVEFFVLFDCVILSQFDERADVAGLTIMDPVSELAFLG